MKSRGCLLGLAEIERGCEENTHVVGDWLETGEEQLIKKASFQSFDENNRNQAGRVGRSLNKTRILLPRELGPFQTPIAPNCLSLMGSQAPRGPMTFFKMNWNIFSTFSGPPAVLSFCLSWWSTDVLVR